MEITREQLQKKLTQAYNEGFRDGMEEPLAALTEDFEDMITTFVNLHEHTALTPTIEKRLDESKRFNRET